MNSNLIMQNFDRASHSYDSASAIQKECCHYMVKLIKKELPRFHPTSILDVGTGTGYLTKLLTSEFPESSYTINDISQSMIDKATLEINKEISTMQGDMDELNFPQFDMIVSSMALHWSSDPKRLIEKLYSFSQVLIFSILIQPSLQEWNEMFLKLELSSPGLNYLSCEDITSSILALEHTHFVFDRYDFHLQFDTPRTFMKYMRNLGSQYSPVGYNPHHVKKILKNFPAGFSSKYSVFFGLVSKIPLQQLGM
ncbi:ubiE/COQ5 methyltransferase family protein [Neorickettsia helminthoeca str. Oregon]|uniref:UbiE/COQ5 methyltransferase family protein n=1 Tax=Neorickettsia helminthoeca str. Oregon TaxID=1286528 RepID=X5H4D5_9RICK|nr:methyltransferase domain-containing protein [Neorickettsia helminthoeca]AHX11528.1 ubiE/COQ5 methyltransferase family protein [Neorickettsia helminthoeca str. Oregon]